MQHQNKVYYKNHLIQSHRFKWECNLIYTALDESTEDVREQQTILRSRYEVFPETGRASATDPHPDHVHSINSEEATAWPFLDSQRMAISAEGEHRTYLVVRKEEGTTSVHGSPQGVQTVVKIEPVAGPMGTRNGTRREVQDPSNVRWNLASRSGRSYSTVSDAYCVKYTTESNDPQKSRSSEYRRVAKELQEGLRIPSKKANATTRGSTFNADFAEQATMDHSDTTKGPGKGTSARTRRSKRAGSLVDEETSRKKLLPVCLACEKRGHSLRDCWYLFEDKRPKESRSEMLALKRCWRR